MTDTERIDRLEVAVTNLEARIRETGDLLYPLERAVLEASDRGDVLASVVQAGSPEQIVKNLIAHFEAVGKAEG